MNLQIILVQVMAVVSVIMAFYSLYLNMKQAKVKSITEDMLNELRSIHETIKSMKVK